MDGYSVNYQNKFRITAPLNWSKQDGPENHLALFKSSDEMIIIRRDDVRLFGRLSLSAYMELLRGNAGKLRHTSSMEMSSIEPFYTPYYEGRIMTYAFTLDGKAAETTLFAFKTDLYFYIMMLQAPASCSHETLSEFFDVVNSFKIIIEVLEPVASNIRDMKFKMMYDENREIFISIPDKWIDTIDSYHMHTDYLIFVSSSDRNQAIGISRTENPEIAYNYEFSTIEIGGMRALQYEEECTPHAILLKYLNTIVEVEGDFYLISCWTPPTFFDAYAELFRFVTNSFTLSKSKGFTAQLH